LDIPIFPLILSTPIVLLGYVSFAVYRWYSRRRDWTFLFALSCFVALIAWLRLTPEAFSSGGLIDATAVA
jgi:hypothetical protein